MGTLVDIFLSLPDFSKETSFSGRVVRLEMVDDKFDVAVKIMDISGHDHAMLVKTISSLDEESPDAAGAENAADAQDDRPTP